MSIGWSQKVMDEELHAKVQLKRNLGLLQEVIGYRGNCVSVCLDIMQNE